MTDERKAQIEEMAERLGLSFASAKLMLEEIEADDEDYAQTMCEIAF